VFSPGSAETNAGSGGKLNGHLMASCVSNIHTKNYQNLVIGFQVTVKNVGDVFTRHSVVLTVYYCVIIFLLLVLVIRIYRIAGLSL